MCGPPLAGWYQVQPDTGRRTHRAVARLRQLPCNECKPTQPSPPRTKKGGGGASTVHRNSTCLVLLRTKTTNGANHRTNPLWCAWWHPQHTHCWGIAQEETKDGASKLGVLWILSCGCGRAQRANNDACNCTTSCRHCSSSSSSRLRRSSVSTCGRSGSFYALTIAASLPLIVLLFAPCLPSSCRPLAVFIAGPSAVLLQAWWRPRRCRLARPAPSPCSRRPGSRLCTPRARLLVFLAPVLRCRSGARWARQSGGMKRKSPRAGCSRA